LEVPAVEGAESSPVGQWHAWEAHTEESVGDPGSWTSVRVRLSSQRKDQLTGLARGSLGAAYRGRFCGGVAVSLQATVVGGRAGSACAGR
jgi:hypothetical protein